MEIHLAMANAGELNKFSFNPDGLRDTLGRWVAGAVDSIIPSAAAAELSAAKVPPPLRNPEKYVSHSYPDEDGNTECAISPRKIAGAPNHKYWTPGDYISPENPPPVGTWVATFNEKGEFKGHVGTFSHFDKDGNLYKPLITKSLYALLSDAVKAEREYDRLPPKDKEAPPYEGSLFSSSVEGYTNFYVSDAVPGSNNAEIYVLLQYALHSYPYYANKPGIMEWKEKVKIIKEGKTCLVDDIYSLPEDADQSLKDRLKEIASESEYEADYYKKNGAASH
jgi:hypothetical protein